MAMPVIDGIPAVLNLAGPVASTLIVFWLVFTGRLVTQAQHLTIVRLLEARVADSNNERDGWKASSERKGETITVLSKSNDTLTESARFSNHVMAALREINEGKT